MSLRGNTASAAVAYATASVLFANIAAAQPAVPVAPPPGPNAGVPPVVGMLHYYESNLRLTGRVGTTSYSWTVPAQSMEQCRTIADAARRASSPGVDGGICLETSTGVAMKLESSRQGFRLVP